MQALRGPAHLGQGLCVQCDAAVSQELHNAFNDTDKGMEVGGGGARICREHWSGSARHVGVTRLKRPPKLLPPSAVGTSTQHRNALRAENHSYRPSFLAFASRYRLK